MSYALSITPAAGKMLESLPRALHGRIREKIEHLKANPRPSGCVKVAGLKHAYRIRIGDYRVIYEIHDDRRIVIIFIIDHRKQVYRRL